MIIIVVVMNEHVYFVIMALVNSFMFGIWPKGKRNLLGFKFMENKVSQAKSR